MERNSKMEKKKLLFIVLISMLLLALIILVLCISPSGENSIFNLTRINNISKDMMKSGISGAPYWIYSCENSGYGYGGSLFFGDLFLYIPSFLVYLGMKVILSYKIFIILIIIFSGISMFLCVKKVFKKTNLSFIIVSAYLIIMFLLIEFLSLKIYSDFAFFVFIPLVILGVFSIIKSDNKKTDIILVAVGISGIIFSQIIIGLFFTVIILVLYLFNIKKRFYLILSLIFMIGITSYYVFPLIEQISESKSLKLEEDDCYKERGEIILSNNKKLRTSFERKRYSFDISFKKNTFEKTYMELPLIMYKGYVAINKDTDLEYKVSESENGLVKIEINNELEGDILVIYRGTEIQNYSVYLSTISFMVLLGFVFWKKGDEKC